MIIGCSIFEVNIFQFLKVANETTTLH